MNSDRIANTSAKGDYGGGIMMRWMLGDRLPPWVIALEALLIFAFHYLIFHWGYLVGNLPHGVDGYYHHTMATLHSFSNLAQDVNFLPYTYLGEHPVNHQWLFHWLLKPFTLIPESSEYSIENATIAWGAAVPAVLSVMLRLARVPLAPLFAVLAVWAIVGTPGRFLMLRAQNLSLVLVLLLQLLALRRRYVAFALALFLFNHAYQAVVLASFPVLAVLMTDFYFRREVDIRLCFSAIVGFGMSLLLSPWFPENVQFFVFHLLFVLMNPFEGYQLSGTEWLPLSFNDFVRRGYTGIFCLLTAALILFRCRGAGRGLAEYQLAVCLFLLGLVFAFMTMRYVRFTEFFGPFSVIALGAAFLVAYHCSRWSWRACVACLTVVLAMTLTTLPLGAYTGKPYLESHARQCDFIRQNYRPGAVIFNASEWAAFSPLFKCVPEGKFIAGLHGKMLAYGDKEVFRIWHMFYAHQYQLREVTAELARDIKRVFDRTDTQFVVFAPEHLTSAVKLSEAIDGLELLMSPDNDFILIYQPGGPG